MDIPSFNDFFSQIKTNLWLIGIPYDNFTFHLRFPVLLISLCVTVTMEFLYLLSRISTENLLELTQLAPCTLIGVLAILKTLAIASKRKKLYQLTENLCDLYSEVERDAEQASLLRPRLVFLKILVKYFFVLNFVLISVYNFSSPLLMLWHYVQYREVLYILPYNLLLPFEVDDSATWCFVYFHTLASSLTCAFYFTTADVIYYVLTSQTCNNFNIIINRFKNMNEDVAVLLRIVKDHQYVLKLADDLEDIFTASNLFNVLVGSLEICALGFNLTTTGDMKQIPGCVLFLFSVLLQILMMSVCGENLITESNNIGKAAYASKWYNMDERSKKIILIILTRSVKPKTLTAYKFSIISYESFSKIISTSWSYFTILKTVYTPPPIEKS